MIKPIQIISAPSILGLKPSGVEKLSESFVSNRLPEKLGCKDPVITVPTLNSKYSSKRDELTKCLNGEDIHDFSVDLCGHILPVITGERFPLVLGGDCSILIGIMPALKAKGTYGLVFCDAHADFYEPEKSITGEVADMDLAIVTGRGPAILTDINNQRPYVADEHVVHIGQRDWEETRKYGSQDIRDTAVNCIDYQTISKIGIAGTLTRTMEYINSVNIEGFWIHFDTDVLSDVENPAVDYRIPGGLSFEEYQQLLTGLLASNRIAGMSVSIFNPTLDNPSGSITKRMIQLLSQSLNGTF